MVRPILNGTYEFTGRSDRTVYFITEKTLRARPHILGGLAQQMPGTPDRSVFVFGA